MLKLCMACVSFHQGGSRAGLELMPNLEQALCVLKAREAALSQDTWFKSITNTLV